MNLAVLGTGAVGRTLGSAWLAAGHAVTLGARSPDNETAAAWAADHGSRATHDAFAGAVRGAEAIVNATAGLASRDVLASCDEADLDGRVLLDAANPLDFSQGFPPTLGVANDDSLAEQIQRDHPGLRVVKGFNTLAVEVMVDPDGVPGDHVVPIAGDDADAKAVVRALMGDLGWPDDRVVDLGDLTAARGLEMWLPLWLRLYGHFGHPRFNLALPQAPDPTPRT